MEFKNNIEVFIEISKNSNIKYEYDKDKKQLICDRILHTPFSYSFNYGFVDNTLSMDGDPIDVVVIMEESLISGCTINCKIIGCLETSDDKGDDPKLIACPIDSIDPNSKEINDINDINKHTLDKIKYFFTHYKDLENKKVIIGNFLNKENSIEIYKQSINNYLASQV
jgi:inorganic pyrophosphatase